MSIHMVEKALFDIAANTQNVRAYRGGPVDYLKAYRLEADEVGMIEQMDVREMINRGVNPMLVMRVFSAIEGREKMPEYMRRLRED
ncbi:MAG: hypothetical protein EPN76_14455 [Burkholderiaceae bacterium]|nr:MAG: hypothetical protein EPN76_14455 [Burkholderiaceae bacterium]TAM02122.1 MAG: hypothetical protein EPN67_11650 [Pusillimonas sp.]